MKIELLVNGKTVEVEAPPDMPLLWVLREQLELTGTKFGCGAGQCGACTVHLDGNPVRACQLPAEAAKGRSVTTIEGLGGDGLHALQKAWVEHNVPQCGYCQSGMLMAVTGLLKRVPKPTEADVEQSVTNLCRCGTYARIRKAILQVAQS